MKTYATLSGFIDSHGFNLLMVLILIVVVSVNTYLDKMEKERGGKL